MTINPDNPAKGMPAHQYFNGKTVTWAESVPGLTIRAELSARAPQKIPIWFNHVPIQRNIFPMPDYNTWAGGKHADALVSWMRDPCWDLQDDLADFQAQYETHQEEERQLKRDNEIERYFQWRTFYADHLIKQLNATTND